MNQRGIFILAGATLLLILGAGAWFFFLLTTPTPNTGVLQGTLPVSQTNNSNPHSSTSGLGVGSNSGSTFEISTKTGAMIVSDFTKGAGIATTSDGTSYVSNFGQSGTTTQDALEYQIFYMPFDKSFLVSILKEPIGDIRRRATADLEARLGISGKDICNIVAEVRLPRGVNNYYEGVNLGFPGCPGAVQFDGDPTL